MQAGPVGIERESNVDGLGPIKYGGPVQGGPVVIECERNGGGLGSAKNVGPCHLRITCPMDTIRASGPSLESLSQFKPSCFQWATINNLFLHWASIMCHPKVGTAVGLSLQLLTDSSPELQIPGQLSFSGKWSIQTICGSMSFFVA